jgi:CHAT domain-containing protein/Flp pilus assembly protein TadD
MKLSGTLLVLLAMLHFLEAETPRTTARVNAVVWQSAVEEKDDPVTLTDRKEALRKLQESIRRSLGEGQTLEAARILNRVGSLHLLLNDPHAAIASHLQALSLLRQSNSTEVDIDNLNGLAAAYLHLEKSDLAEATLKKAITLSRQSGYILGQARALLILSDCQNHSNHAIALLTAQRALELWQRVGDTAGLARTYSQIGTCYFAQNLLTEAAQGFEQALEHWQELNNAAGQAEALIKLGYIEYRKGEWQGSINYYTRAQGMLDEIAEPEKMGQIASGMAAAFNESGLPENGLRQYQRALDYYRQTQQPQAINYALWGLGRTYYLLGDFPSALSYLQQSLDGVDQNTLLAAPALQYLGRINIALGEYDAGLKNLRSALNIYAKAVNPKEAAQVNALLGQIYDRKGNLGRARHYYEKALKSFAKLGDRVNQAAVYYALGQLQLKSKNYDAAISYLRQSIDVTENILSVSTSSDLTAAFSATVHERYESYIECLMKQHEAQPTQGFAVRAFETSEFARARSLSELLRAVQTKLAPGLDPQLAEQEKSLRQSLRMKGNDKVALLGTKYSREDLVKLESDVTRLEGQYRQVAETIRERYPSYDQISRPSSWGLRQIQELILADDETVLLEYSLGADSSYVWAVTRNGITSNTLPGEKVINEAAQQVYALLATSPTIDTENKLAQASELLSQMVLAPVASSLNKRRLIIVADGALNYIPFQLLPAPADDGEALISRYEVINTPSASILGQLRRENARHRAPAKVLAAFGDPVFASNYARRNNSKTNGALVAMETNEIEPWHGAWRDIEVSGDSFDAAAIQPLFYTSVELVNLREVAGADTLIATGFDASRESLETTDLSKYAILHFATHGILDPKRPEHSGLFLSMVSRDGHPQNGFITMQDIYRLHSPVELVVLSACRTGLGKDVRGEGLIGLTRGFMYAGASSVVASLWKVDDESTAELMRRFYANMLQNNMTPAAALRAAQNSIRREPQWHSPYYWAAFTLQGEYLQVIKAPPPIGTSQLSRRMLVGGVLMALLAGIGYWYCRYRKAARP